MSHSMKLLVVRLIVMAGLLITSQVMAATVPKSLNYQGTLTDINGNLIDGNRDITVKLYAVNSGGTHLWSKTQNGIPVIKGNFSFVIGDDLYPLNPDILSGTTYIGITVGTDPEMVPRQQLTSVAYALKSGDSIPVGAIIMWSGAIDALPAGWVLCDGSNDTPDLRNRFIVGAGKTGPGTEYLTGDTGGEKTHVLGLTEMPSHTHLQDPHNHAQTDHSHGVNDPGHVHTVPLKQDDQDGSGSNGTTAGSSNSGTGYTGIWLSGATANISPFTAINKDTGGGQAHENRPPYYALAFIMKRY